MDKKTMNDSQKKFAKKFSVFHKMENAETAKTSPNPLIPRLPIVNRFSRFNPKCIPTPKMVLNKLLHNKIAMAPKTTRNKKFKIKSFMSFLLFSKLYVTKFHFIPLSKKLPKPCIKQNTLGYI